MRDKLRQAQRGSKSWWKIANVIMDKDEGAPAIPSLQVDGVWANVSVSKANLVADTFASKFSIPDIEANEFDTFWPERHWDGFVTIRSSHVSKVLAKLDKDNGTGPDGLAAQVLKICSRELGRPLAKLVRRIVAESHWPSAWIVHWLLPLHKRNSKSDPTHYRAINLTTQISKSVERFLKPHFAPTSESGAFGVSQFAYRNDHEARDAVLFYVLSWIASMNDGCKVCIYCSDVAGAFDRVDAERLMRKLSAMNLNVRLLR